MTDQMPIDAWDHIELWVGNARQAAYFYERAYGYTPIAYCGPETGTRDRASYVLAQGDDDQLAIRLHHEFGHIPARVGIETGIERAIGIDPRDMVALRGRGRAIGLERGESATEQNFAIRLHRDQSHIGIGVGIEIGVQRTVGIEPRDVMARHAEDGAKVAGDDDPPIRLLRRGVDGEANEIQIERIEVARRGVGGRGDSEDGGQAEGEEAKRQVAHMARVALIGELAATMSHELRQPLAAIRANAEAGALLLARSSRDQGEAREIFQHIVADDARATVGSRARTTGRSSGASTAPVRRTRPARSSSPSTPASRLSCSASTPAPTRPRRCCTRWPRA